MARNKYDIDEELEEGFDFGQLKRLAKYVGPYKKDMIKAIVIMLLSSALSMLIPRFFMTIMDVYIPEGNIKGIVMLSIATMAIVVFVCASLKTKIILTNRVGQNVIYALRRDLFVHLQELPFSYYDDRPHGKIQVRVVNYVN
ncbi:multidrug ABC transporter ATP-binding protein, partial [Lachnotalea glycerini]